MLTRGEIKNIIMLGLITFHGFQFLKLIYHPYRGLVRLACVVVKNISPLTRFCLSILARKSFNKISPLTRLVGKGK